MRRLLLIFLLTATAFSYVIEYSGSVDVYYRCSPYVTEFGICHGDCFGFCGYWRHSGEAACSRLRRRCKCWGELHQVSSGRLLSAQTPRGRPISSLSS